MGRTLKQTVKITDIVIDNELYPRVGTFWQNIYKYAENMRAGARFPRVLLAKLGGSLVLVDGRHRLEAYKLLKKKEVPALIQLDWDRKKVLEEAIRTNVTHGVSLSPYELRKLVLKLRVMKFSEADISGIINVPLGKLERFVAKGAVSAITGKPLRDGESHEQVIIKRPLKHLAGGEYNQEQIEVLESSQVTLAAKDQVNLLKQVVVLMENNLLDMNSEDVQVLVDRIKVLVSTV